MEKAVIVHFNIDNPVELNNLNGDLQNGWKIKTITPLSNIEINNLEYIRILFVVEYK